MAHTGGFSRIPAPPVGPARAIRVSPGRQACRVATGQVGLSILSLADMDDIDLLARSELFSAFDQEHAGQPGGVGAAGRVRAQLRDVRGGRRGRTSCSSCAAGGSPSGGGRSMGGSRWWPSWRQGDLFGEMSAVRRGDPFGFGARPGALARCSAFPTAWCARRSTTSPELLWEVVRLLAERLRNTDSALADAVFLDVTGRTAKRLLELAGDAGRLPAADHPGGAGRPGGCIQRAGQQVDRRLHPARAGSSSSTVATGSWPGIAWPSGPGRGRRSGGPAGGGGGAGRRRAGEPASGRRCRRAGEPASGQESRAGGRTANVQASRRTAYQTRGVDQNLPTWAGGRPHLPGPRVADRELWTKSAPPPARPVPPPP